MGVWGYKNFEADDSLNVLCSWVNRIIDEIRQTYKIDNEKSLYGNCGDAKIVANVDILGTLYEKYELYHDLQLSEVIRWKQDYLETFDRILSSYPSEPSEFANKRRIVVEDTFDRLCKILQEISDLNEDE
ncbi:MAG: hypothetical protein RLP44_26250 [Aggregatilineales bacterium]